MEMASFHIGMASGSIVTEERMRDVNRIAVRELGPTLYPMVENTGRSMTSLCMTMLGDAQRPRPVGVIAMFSRPRP